MMTLEKTWKIDMFSKIRKAEITYLIYFVLLFLAILNARQSSASDLTSTFGDRSKYVINIQNNNAFSIDDIRATTANSVPVKINLPASLSTPGGKKTWLRVLGLPDGLQFSKGAQVNQIWFIPSQDTSNLRIKLPNGYTGSFNLNFFLMRGEQTVVSIMGKEKIKVTILTAAAQSEKQEPAQSAASDQSQTQEKLTPKEETILLKRADQLMKLGTFAPARIIYEELALRGSATAAENLAGTYDPSVIQNSSISGLEPDVELARKWYEHARKLRSQAIN